MIAAAILCASMMGCPTVVGDSIAYSARHQLADRGFNVDAWPGRRMDRVRKVPRSSVVVYELFTNGRVDLGTCTRLVRATTGNVWLVTNTRHPSNNRVLRSCAGRTGAGIVHWAGYTHRHEGLLKQDGIHLTKKGKRAFSRLVSRTTARG